MRVSFCVALCLFLLSGVRGQQPVLQGYPFAKGTYFQAVEEDGLMYCTTDLGLAIWDIGDPLQPALLSHYVYTGIFLDGKTVKRGSIVFLGKGRGIQAVDVSDPANPVGQMLDLGDPGHSGAFEVMDTLLFTTRGGSLITWSISDLENPVPLDTFSLDLNSLSRTDTILIGGQGNRAYRMGIGTGFPILLDEMSVQDNYLLGSVQYASDRLALYEEEPMNGQTLLTLYDVSVAGSPVVQEVIHDLPIGGRILHMDGALLVFATDTDLQLYDISQPGQALWVSTVATSWPHRSAVFHGDRMFTMSEVFGFSVFQRTGPAALTWLAGHDVGDRLWEMQQTSTGHVIGHGRDSLYVLDPQAAGVGAGIRDSRYYDALAWWVFGDLLVEMRTVGVGEKELTLVRVEADGTFQQLSTLYPSHPGNSYQLGIWNDRLYWGSYYQSEDITDIYDVSDPSIPVYMGFAQALFQLERDGILFSLFPDMGWVDLYDAATFPPASLSQKNFNVDCLGRRYPDPERTLVHMVGNGCYSVIDLRDTADVQVLGPLAAPAQLGAMQGTGVWNKILYIPYLNGRVIHLLDVGVPGFLTPKAELHLSSFPLDLAFVDSTLLVAFGGYVEQYDVSSILPDMTVQVPEKAPVAGPVIYPNPATGGFYIRQGAGTFEVELRDALGRPVRSRIVTAGTADTWVPCRGLPTGLYTVRLRKGTEVATLKLVLE